MPSQQRLTAARAGRACPKCGEHLPAEAILCVSCGFHLVHGRVLKTKDQADLAREQPRDPSRIWLIAAFCAAAFGATVIGGAILFASRPESIVGKWTGHAAFEFRGLPVIGDDISLTFHENGIVTCSDGTAGPYAI